MRPGDYKVFAGPPGALPLGGLTPELLSTVEAGGAGVTVKAGSSAVANVGVLTN